MRKLFLAVAFAIIFLNTVLAGIQISEIMYDPTCSYDSYCEWIEIYNNGTDSVDMTNWSISDGDANDTLEGYGSMIIPGNTYALIVDDDTRIYNEFEIKEVTWLYTGDDAIGDKLSSEDEIILYNENANIAANIDYGNTDSGNTWALINGSWQETTPTPGRDNVENTTYANDYSKIKISEFMPDPEGDDNALIPNGEWVELYNSGSYDLDLLGFYFKDNNGNDADLIITNTTTDGSTIINSKKYLTVYTNGISGFLNNDGFEKISFYDLNNDLIDSVSYSESDEGVSWSLSEDKWQKATPSKNNENFDNRTSLKSELNIEEVYDLGDGRAEWGDIIRVKFFVYRGNTGKETVWIWVEDSIGNRITKKSKFNLYTKFQNYSFTYPIMIPENCDNEFISGNGKIVVEGLDATDEAVLEIRGTPLCKQESSKTKVKSLEYEIIEFEDTADKDLDLNVKLKNNQEEALNVDLWSYVYSGKTHYVEQSDTENLKKVELKSGEEKIVELNNNVKKLEKNKDYKVKVNILREDRKNPYQITKDFKVVKNEVKSESIKKGLEPITGDAVYESKGTKAQRMGVFFFAGMMMGLAVYSFIRKWK